MNDAGRTLELNDVKVLLADDLVEIPGDSSELVLVTGTHAGIGSARTVMRHPPILAVFNDAGVGKDRAGIAGLDLLEAFNIPAAAVDVASARIGDASDTLDNGIVSACNEHARQLGVAVGKSIREVIGQLGGNTS